MKNTIVKTGLYGYTPSELADFEWKELINLWDNISVGEENLLYHLVIHKDCPIGFFLKYWVGFNACISENRVKILSNIKIISNSDILKSILRISTCNEDEIKSTYRILINDKQSSWHAIFRKNSYVTNIVKFEVSNELEYLPNETKEIFIF